MKIIRYIMYFLIILLFLTCSSNRVAYSISYETSIIRGDGAATYFLLIKPVDLKNDSFKKDVNRIIKEMVQAKGDKISINIFDDEECLEKSYQNQINTVKFGENKEEVRHHIADYRGKTQYGSWIMFFPGFSSSALDPLLEKYFELKIFDLSKL